MRNLIKSAFTIILATVMLSCAKESRKIDVQNNNATIDVCIDAAIEGYSAQEEAKASAETVIRIKWAGGETVYVYDGVTPIGFLTASIEGTDGTYAKLSGTITAPSGTKPITLVYSPLYSDAAPAVDGGKISLDLSMQDKAEVPFLIYGVLPATTALTINDAVVKFTLATSIYKCNCADLPEGDISYASIDGINTVCELTLSDSAEPAVGGSTPGTITRSAGFTTSKADHRAIFSVALAKSDESSGRSIQIVKGGKINDATFSKTAFDAAKSINAVFMFRQTGELVGKFSVAEGKQVHFSLGNLWADATDPENPVFYFETNQNGFMDSWSTSHVNLFYWNKDAKVVVKKIYDGANSSVFFTNATDETAKSDFTVNGVSGKYRTLTLAEWKYLFDSHSYKWVTVYGVGGIVIAPDGKTLQAEKTTYTEDELNNDNLVFLPAAGSRYESNFSSTGDMGYYWSSSVFNVDPNYPTRHYLFFHEFRLSYEGGGPDLGYSVRLVADCK